MRRLTPAIICCVVMGWGTGARAAPLNLTLNTYPDVTANLIDVSYLADNSPNNFNISGYDTAMNDDGVGPLLNVDSYDPGSYSIMATVTTAGVATAGSLVITGDYTSTLGISGTLVTGSLSTITLPNFGYHSPGSGLDFFEFVFTVTGGLMATSQYFGVPGTELGVQYDAQEDLFASDATAFASSFSSAPFGDGWTNSRADTAPIPEPATLSLILLAGMALSSRRRVR